MSGFALLCLLAGQRLAKDYAGAAVVAAYFAVAVIGVALF
jgi:diacylglycerol kinase